MEYIVECTLRIDFDDNKSADFIMNFLEEKGLHYMATAPHESMYGHKYTRDIMIIKPKEEKNDQN